MLTLLTTLATAATALHPAAPVLTEPGEIPQLRVVGSGADLPLRHTDVFIHVSGLAARAEVRQRYRNDTADVIEVEYVFPLPENAAVDGMRFEIEGRIIEGRIRKRAEAKEEYEAAKAQGKRAALLEQERPNVFRQKLANIAPGDSIDVVVSYVQELSYADGWTEVVFPMVVGQRFVPPGPRREADLQLNPPVFGDGVRDGHDISIDVVVEPGAPIVDVAVPTHEVDMFEEDGTLTVTLAERGVLPNRDFVLRWQTGDSDVQLSALAHRPDPGAAGWLTLVVKPPVVDAPEAPPLRELVFVVDVSGSMNGLPLAMARAFMEDALRGLRPEDTFDVMTFSGGNRRLFGEPRPASADNIRLALEIANGWTAQGGTMMADAVAAALRPDIAPDRERTVVFLTDGYVGNEDQIIAEAAQFVGAQPARVIAIGTSASPNRHLIDGLGTAGKGFGLTTTTLDEATAAVDRLYRVLDRPVIEDVRIVLAGGAATEMTPSPLPDLFSTRPLVVHLRYDGAGPARVVLTGRADGRRITRELPVELPAGPVDRPALATLWAQSQIRSHQRQIWVQGEHSATEDVEAVTRLALAHAIVTPYTSFVAVDHAGEPVGDGAPKQVQQASHAVFVAGKGAAGMGFRGAGTGGGGGMGYGRIHGLGSLNNGGGTGSIRAQRASVTPRLKVGALKGELTSEQKALFLRILKRRSLALRTCLEVQARKTTVGLWGSYRLQITVSPKGRVTAARVVPPSGAPKAAAACMQRVLRRVRFPKQDDTVRIELPIIASH